ncbi:hypothetical protein BpHYR1_047599 [Brachionus plicatilis]|uniref:Uncharacterized protein n=1 Tax=Brachionus plicatilis TaxID=10195 RepID=A0A3M7RSC6_BRAPC|nr:hypothetical protein BpHYR1_047599 [Brachionus plicatilis]
MTHVWSITKLRDSRLQAMVAYIVCALSNLFLKPLTLLDSHICVGSLFHPFTTLFVKKFSLFFLQFVRCCLKRCGPPLMDPAGPVCENQANLTSKRRGAPLLFSFRKRNNSRD